MDHLQVPRVDFLALVYSLCEPSEAVSMSLLQLRQIRPHLAHRCLQHSQGKCGRVRVGRNIIFVIGDFGFDFANLRLLAHSAFKFLKSSSHCVFLYSVQHDLFRSRIDSLLRVFLALLFACALLRSRLAVF